MTHIANFEELDFELCVGNKDCIKNPSPSKIFKDEVINFCSDLSKEILKDDRSRDFSDLVTLAFFCRKASIHRLSKSYVDDKFRLGWGRAVHITPSNIPINTAFSFIISLLAGNNNIVRIPTKKFQQLELFLDLFKDVSNKEEHKWIRESNCFFRTKHDDLFLKKAIEQCEVRLVWGGDETIRRFRKYNSKSSCVELAFPERKSICIIDAESFANLKSKEVFNLCDRFYNDTLLVDQMACSSPSVIIWVAKNNISKIKEKFWEGVKAAEIRNGPLGVKKYIDKVVQVGSSISLENNNVPILKEYGLGTTVEKGLLDKDIILHSTIGFGRYKELQISNLDPFSELISRKIQTVTFFGVDPYKIANLAINNGYLGIDRIVPIGDALNMGLLWDGKDLIRTLSRVIKINEKIF